MSAPKPKIVKLKKEVKTRSHNPNKKLRDVDFILKAINQCMLDNDVDAAIEILKGHYEAVNKKELFENVISKRTFYNIFSGKTKNPRTDQFFALISGLQKTS